MNFVNILNIWKFYSVHGCVSGLLVFRMLWGIIMIYIFAVSYFIYNLFDRTIGCASMKMSVL